MRYFILFLVFCFMSLALLFGEDVTAVAEEAATDAAAVVPSGIAGWIGYAVAFVLGWLAKSKVLEKLIGDALKKVDATEIGAQLQVDNHLAKLVETTIPSALSNLQTQVQRRVASGKVTSSDVEAIAKEVWQAIAPEVKGGVRDYLKESSWDDAMVMTKALVSRFLTPKS